MDESLTENINKRISDLKSRVDTLPSGGCLLALKCRLEDLRIEVMGFIAMIDRQNEEGTKE